MKKYDILVIGSGGGSKISTPASKLGYKVALVEKGPLGGTCLNRGCIPSKMLIHAADVAQNITESERFQIHTKGFEVDFAGLVDRVSATIDGESQGIYPWIEKNPNIDLYSTPARFVGQGILQVGDEQITADKIMIAVGARPTIPNIPGLEKTPFLTSTDALRLNRIPKSMIIVGSGFIATELAHYFGSLGVNLTILVRSEFLKNEDHEISEEFKRVFCKRFHVLFNAQPTQVNFQNDQFQVTVQIGKETVHLEAEQLLMATGVTPNGDTLDLTKTGVTLDARGFIQVDDHLRTFSPNIWAFGDCVGRYLLRHNANWEGDYLLASVIYQDHHEPIQYRGMPSAVFTYPQIASVGETEAQLKKRGASYVVGKNPYSSSAMGMALLSDHGFVKLLIEQGSHEILGCHIVGHEASVLIHEIIPLYRLRLKLEDILFTVHIHPALSELVRNAARRARDQLVSVGETLSTRLKIA